MEDLKDKIVNTSFVEFLNRGYKACSLRDLEVATGLTKGAFYYYFKNKKEILKAGIEKYFTTMREITMQEATQIISLKAYVALVMKYKEESAALSLSLFKTSIMETLFFQLVLEVSSLFPGFRERIYGISRNRLNCWEYMIAKAKAKGEIRETLNTAVLARNLMAVSVSMLNLELKNASLKFILSDTRMQFEQYYHLIKK